MENLISDLSELFSNLLTNPIDLLIILGIPLGVFFLTLAAGIVLRKIIFDRVAHFTKHADTEIDDETISVVRTPFILWCTMLAIYFALSVSRLPRNVVRICDKSLLVLGTISVTLIFANLFSRIVKNYSRKLSGTAPMTSFTQNIGRLLIFTTGILVIIRGFGISITPALAGLGIGGLAVALALQDTLTNIFAGFYIIISQQLKVGDYVKLETGEEGYITDINWRTTRIRMITDNIILVPNDKILKAISVNYYLPEKEMLILVNVGVHYKSDLEKVERVTLEVAREVMKTVPGGVPNFEPYIRYYTFGDYAIYFNAHLRVREFVEYKLVQHEFIKRLQARYLKENIVIPYPIRAINYAQEKTPSESE